MSRTKVEFIVYYAFIVLFTAMIMALPVSAVRVESAVITLDVAPGMTYHEPVALSLSPGDPGGSFAIAVAGFGQSPFDGTYTGLEPVKDTGPYTARPFISLEQPVVSLEPGGSAVTNATIAMPADAREGGRYAVILVYPAASLSGQAQPAPVAVIPVFLSIREGNITETGEITALEITTRDAGDELQVATYFQNTGNHHFSGAVNTVTVTDHSGAVIAREQTPPFDRALIPGQEVRFSVSTGESLPDPEYQLTSRIELKDGTLLAERTESLEGTGSGTENTTPPPALPGTETPARPAPGYSTGIALLVLLAVVTGGRPRG